MKIFPLALPQTSQEDALNIPRRYEGTFLSGYQARQKEQLIRWWYNLASPPEQPVLLLSMRWSGFVVGERGSNIILALYLLLIVSISAPVRRNHQLPYPNHHRSGYSVGGGNVFLQCNLSHR